MRHGQVLGLWKEILETPSFCRGEYLFRGKILGTDAERGQVACVLCGQLCSLQVVAEPILGGLGHKWPFYRGREFLGSGWHGRCNRETHEQRKHP